MSKQALYRKYRSRTLDEVIGQDHITSVLDAAIKSGNFSHAYLLTGPRGTGKTSIARIIAHMINGLEYSENTNLDIIEIDAASNTSVDNIRDLREKINIMPTSAKYKVYIIDEVHMLSSGAFNALLKTLEEPPAHVVFILATTEVRKLPATILSRSQRFHFHPVSAEKVAAHLKHIAQQEKIEIDDEALLMIAKRGEGSFRDSISLLDQLSGLDRAITKTDVEDVLGLVPNDRIDALVQSIVDCDLQNVVNILAEFREQGIGSNMIVEQLITKLIEAADSRPKLYDLVDKLIDVPKSHNPDIKLLAVLANASTGSKTVATTATKPTPVVIKEKVERKTVASNPALAQPAQSQINSANPESRKEKPVVSIVNEPEPEYVAKPEKSSELQIDIDWEKVVSSAKEINPPVASIIEKASFDQDGDMLTLYFNFKIYRDKMNDSKNRKVLVSAIMAAGYDLPKIQISDERKPKSEKAASVAAIMGGGEVI